LALEELLLFQIQMKQSRNAINNNYVVHCKKTSLVKRIISNLPFSLTLDQERVVMEIFSDMEKPCQMNRLLQGDVGAGKTVIAALAMAKAVDSGFQAAIMAPTGILAEQHF
jgi:ATP-dependent DNA helicase RecG